MALDLLVLVVKPIKHVKIYASPRFAAQICWVAEIPDIAYVRV